MQRGCPKCGRMIDRTYTKCPYCHYDFEKLDVFYEKNANRKYIESSNYAGFIKRLVANLLDSIIFAIILAPIATAIYMSKIDINKYKYAIGMIGYFMNILYFSIMERTNMRGTFGKYIVGIQVVDTNENPITFAHAVVRNMAKILNALTLGIGFLMCGFTKKKQTLSDKAAGIYVINRLELQIEDPLDYANPWARFFAYLLDQAFIAGICYGLIYLVGFLTAKVPNLSVPLTFTLGIAKYILAFVIVLFYYPFHESTSGSTIGKKIMHIELTNLDGEKMNFVKAFIRQFFIALDVETFGYLLPLVDKKRQTVTDKIFKTVVINR